MPVYTIAVRGVDSIADIFVPTTDKDEPVCVIYTALYGVHIVWNITKTGNQFYRKF